MDNVRRLQVDSTDDSYIEERVYRVAGQYTTWTTIATIAPSFTTNLFGSGMVEATIVGLTNGIGVGVHHSQWVWNFNAGALTFTTMYTDESQTSAPQFRLTNSGSNIVCQVQGDNGNGSITGSISLKIHVPSGQTVTYTIT